MDELLPLSETGAPPMARPVAAPSASSPTTGAIVGQLGLVFGVVLAWHFFYAWFGAGLVSRYYPRAALYVHLVGLAVLTLATIGFAMRRECRLGAAVGLTAPLTWRELRCGLLFFIPCYLANIAVSTAYVMLSKRDVTEIAVNKMDKLEVIGEISLAAVLPVSILVGIYEEVLFRGFLLSRLRAAFGRIGAGGTVLAVVVSSAAFGLGHVYQGGLGVAQTTAVGLVLALLAVWRRSIWACIVAHIGIDTFGLFFLKIVAPKLMRMLEAATQPA